MSLSGLSLMSSTSQSSSVIFSNRPSTRMGFKSSCTRGASERSSLFCVAASPRMAFMASCFRSASFANLSCVILRVPVSFFTICIPAIVADTRLLAAFDHTLEQPLLL
eukprot:TRINITY_DN8451_c0_g1_i1.p1 TRINITY_DN8451_c0_g1~~TRINITY_DN8451_c0_g1_i1.p1  ORF type:complete len:108 (+),score=6.70 TRINITY_DN8451_c0_g1_i1:16-339(+)